ncbi:MAG: M15 family metallopeptidase [Bacteroidales bacterium]|nr:M15 family metallopeptidase [Bacteroidales bacterium]
MKKGTLFIVVVGMLYLLLAAGFNFLPRSTYSELEKRDLMHFPSFTLDSLADGSYTSAISSWYSDTEPYRDTLMYFSMQFKDMVGLRIGEEAIEFVAGDTPVEAEETVAAEPVDPVEDTVRVKPFEYEAPEGSAEDIAKVASSGIILVGSGENVRALMGFFGTEKGGQKYAEAVNQYGKAFGDAVHVWCMPIPTSTEFYCPEQAARFTKKQWPVFNSIFEHLSDGVQAVDIYSELSEHTDEPIYLRTDHHWAPLGAYYAARKFASVAGVPFEDLSTYEEHVVHGYVGSMYGYSKNIAVKKAPEDFYYYIPTGVEYSTTYINYTLDEEFHVTGEGRPYKSKYFFSFKDGSGAAYTTFMGGDIKQTKVETSVRNGRRLLVIKDSFGNAVPGYLFHSFEEVHVADFRYFTKNVVNYVDENHITDILFAQNITNTCVGYTYTRLRKFLQPVDPGLSAFRADTIPEAVKVRMTGKSYPEENARIQMSELRYLKLLYYDYNGRVRTGEMVCNQAIAGDLLYIFKELYKAKYQINSIRLIDDFDADDERSMAADNTSCFNYRTATGSEEVLSAHARGLAVDVNPLRNPYVKEDVVKPEAGSEFADRTLEFEHKLTEDDLCVKLFKSKGFQWGGSWHSLKDYQHFEKKQ